MPEQMEDTPPASRDALAKAFEVQRDRIERWRSARVKEIGRKADQELACLERGVQALSSPPVKRSTKATGRAGGDRKTPAAKAAELRAAILRLLDERGEPLTAGEIRRTLGASEFSTRNAIKRLVQEGKVDRTGTGINTRYKQAGKVSEPSPNPEAGASEESVERILRSRGYASLQELGQALGASPEDVRRLCGGLIARGRARMEPRNGQSVYLLRRAA